MSQIVIGIGASHGPSIQNPPELWAKFGEKDKRDRRFDYHALLASAPTEIEREITLSVQQARHAAVHVALKEAASKLAAAAPDVIVIVSNVHTVRPSVPRPVFSIIRASEFPVLESLGRTFESAPGGLTGDVDFAEPMSSKKGHPELADQLVSGLIKEHFDVACIDQLPAEHALDESFGFCYKWLMANQDIPVVPLIVSRDLPNQPSPARVIDIGQAVRKVIDRSPLPLKIGIIASGGLSHQVVDEELDRSVLRGLQEGNFEELANIPRATMNRAPGTPEILNWLLVGSCMRPSNMTLIGYQPCYRSAAGTGHGVAFSCWE